jgi:NADPH:quinone reductase-like Zn-dependent oxidoreductase
VGRDDLAQVLAMAAEGKLKPVIHRVLPLDMAHQAHRLLADKSAIGRVVLVPSTAATAAKL